MNIYYMALPKNRYACMSDLKAYFKKSDLLSGLTEFEKKELRKNIGVIDYTGEAGQITPINITYAALWEQVQRNQIIVGGRYIITDFQTIYSSNNIIGSAKQTWGLTINPSPIYRLLVTGIDVNKLDSRAYIIGKDWTIEYDITQKTLEDGVKDKGRITYLKDNGGNSAFYDFKSVKFRRTRTELRNTTIPITDDYVDLYTFSALSSGNIVSDSSEGNTLVENNELGLKCWNNVFIGNTFNNIFEEECTTNTFIRGCHDSHFLWNTFNNLFHEPVAYTTGSIYNKTMSIGNTIFSTAITKTIHKVNDATIVSFLDPITYAYQVIIL